MNPSFFWPLLFSPAERNSIISAHSEKTNSSPILPNPVDVTKYGWEQLLAEARSRFVQYLLENNNSRVRPGSFVLEIDSGKSLLSAALNRKGIKASQITPQEFQESSFEENCDLIMTHNLLQDFSSEKEVRQLLNKASSARLGMIHQVSSLDDPHFVKNRSLSLQKTASEWSEFFVDWSKNNEFDYYGAHRGMPHRPYNFVLSKSEELHSYFQYDQHPLRVLIRELTLANAISSVRIPLLLSALAHFKNDPKKLAGAIAVIHGLDVVDGQVSRVWGFGNSPYGETVDWVADHITEILLQSDFSKRDLILKGTSEILFLRNLVTDLPRIASLVEFGPQHEKSHPHESFGAAGFAGRLGRALYGGYKLLGDMAIPLYPKGGTYISIGHVLLSLYRAKKLLQSDEGQRYYRNLFAK